MSQFKHQLRLGAAETLERVLPYTKYSIGNSEYLGHYDGDLETLIDELTDAGYHYQLFAAEKTHDGLVDDGSYARIPNEHPDAVAETALEDRPPGECQYHVHPFELEETIELYGHYEIHPYPHTPFFDLTRSWPQHYRPTWDTDEAPRSEWTYLRGVLDPRIESILA